MEGFWKAAFATEFIWRCPGVESPPRRSRAGALTSEKAREGLGLVEEKQGRLSSSTGAAVAAVGVAAISQADPVTRARLHAGRAKPSSRGQQ